MTKEHDAMGRDTRGKADCYVILFGCTRVEVKVVIWWHETRVTIHQHEWFALY